MANRTVKDAHSVKGTNPQYLIEKIIRSRIYESKFWKEQCFALSGNISGYSSLAGDITVSILADGILDGRPSFCPVAYCC